MKFEATKWIAVALNVLASLAMTRFTRDPELCDV
jgi:hypothetical protein